jgi:hypothetical protein
MRSVLSVERGKVERLRSAAAKKEMDQETGGPGV